MNLLVAGRSAGVQCMLQRAGQQLGFEVHREKPRAGVDVLVAGHRGAPVIAMQLPCNTCASSADFGDGFSTASLGRTAIPEARMANSRQIAGLVGPSLCVVLISEFPLVQPHLYDAQIPPVVYLSGALFFVAGLAIVRAHNLWVRAWPVLITVTGWFFLVLGLVRMFAASQYRQASSEASSTTFMVLEGLVLVIALVITYFGYRREPK